MSESPINQATFDELVAGTGADFVVELIDTFLDDIPNMFNDLRQALVTQKAEVFQRAAHSLKSNSASFGAMDLAAQAKDLELIGKNGNLNEVGDRLTRLTTELERVQKALRAWQHAHRA